MQQLTDLDIRKRIFVIHTQPIRETSRTSPSEMEAEVVLDNASGPRYYGYEQFGIFGPLRLRSKEEAETIAIEKAIAHATQAENRAMGKIETSWWHRMNPCDIDAYKWLSRVQSVFEFFGTDCRCCSGARVLAALLVGLATGFFIL